MICKSPPPPCSKAIEVIKSHMERFPAQTDLTHVNILAELYGEVGPSACLLPSCWSLLADPRANLAQT